MDHDYLKAFYEGRCDEDARLRSRQGMVEFLTTMRYIERYLEPGDRVIEIGTGTGRYAHALAQKGYTVDAVELQEHNIEVFKQNTLPGEPVTVRQGNALDLSEFPDGVYDITLLLGPMYHLYTAEEQKKALTEALRATKSGGVAFAAYCGNDATRLHSVGTDLFTFYMKDTIDQMDEELYGLYLQYHFAVCERPDLVGASNHFLDVFWKL